MTRVLLITGARSLADDPAAEAWARGLIAEALRGVDLLIVGDAPGPDAWAWEIAEDGWLLIHDVSTRPEAMRRIHCYRIRGVYRGQIVLHDGYMHGKHFALDTIGDWNRGPDTHPLRRNAAMVADAARMLRDGDNVRCLALLDGRKPAVVKPGEKRPTRGTEHTVGLARAAGLTVDARTWPKGATT